MTLVEQRVLNQGSSSLSARLVLGLASTFLKVGKTCQKKKSEVHKFVSPFVVI